MATSNQTSIITHTNTTDFRAWSSQISTQLQAIGLIKTADTGQIDFTTVLYSGTLNTALGYEIYRFNDALQGTRPIFIKIEYGTAGNAAFPAIWLTVGSGTNGAGTLTGIIISRTQMGRNTTASGVPTQSIATYSAADSFLGFAGWLSGSVTSPFGYFFFTVSRPKDDAGAPTDEAVVMHYYSTQPVHTVYSFVTGATVTAGSAAYTFVPSNAQSSVVGTDVQLYRHFCGVPRVRHLSGLCTYFNTEISRGTTFQATLVGVTPRTYIALGDGYTNSSLTSNTNLVLAMLFE